MARKTPDLIFRQKLELLSLRQERLLSYVRDTMQQALITALRDKMIDNLETVDGKIIDSPNNMRLVNAVERIFDRFDITYGGRLAGQMTDDLFSIGTLNEEYYALYRFTTARRFQSIKTQVNRTLRASLGIDSEGNLTRGGYIDLLINDTTLRRKVANMTYNAVRQGKPLSDFRKGLAVIIEGTEEAEGELLKYYRTFAYDKYQEYDRAYNTEFAKRLDLKAFRYAGGLIETSRDFCEHRNGKVFTVEEAQSWADDPELPRTKAEQDAGVVTDYNPLVNMGRWNCRHAVRFISQEQAIRDRPELAEYFEQLELV